MYPQTVVPLTNSIHKALTDGEDEYGNTVTQLKDAQGKAIYYTANRNATAWNPDDNTTEERNEVYSYLGDRYVKVTPYSREAYNTTTNNHYVYNHSTLDNPDPIGRSGYRWFKVEPIKWIVLNYDWLPEGTIDAYDGEYAYDLDAGLTPHTSIELFAADVLISGIPISTTGNSIWSGSATEFYLHDSFFKEAFTLIDSDFMFESTIYNNLAEGETVRSDITDIAYNSNSNYLLSGGMNPIVQKIYLLSNYELSNENSPYVKNGIFKSGSTVEANVLRKVKGTDYARAHYIYLYGEFTQYWTRTSYNDLQTYRITTGGGVSYEPSNYFTSGTRPALQINEWLC